MTKPQPLIVAPSTNGFGLETAQNGEIPATPDENVAASALLTLLSSPSLGKVAQKEAPNGWAQPALKRQKSDPSLKRRVLSTFSSGKPSEHGDSKPACLGLLDPTPTTAAVTTETELPEEKMDIPSVVARALGGEPVEASKLAEAEKWLYQSVELVRGKYKGRTAAVVGMTAKKYRVRVEGVEHQLEFYPSMFKTPSSAPPKPEAAVVPQAAVAGDNSSKPEGVAPKFPATMDGMATHNTPPNTTTIEGDAQSGSSGGQDEVSQDTCPNASRGPSSPAVTQAPTQSTGTGGVYPPKTSADLLKLMEETSVEMSRARSMLAAFPPSPVTTGGGPPMNAFSSSTTGLTPALRGSHILTVDETESVGNKPAVMGQSTHPNQPSVSVGALRKGSPPQGLSEEHGPRESGDALDKALQDKAPRSGKAAEVISTVMSQTHI